MKKLFIAFALTSTLFACKKVTSTPDNTGNNTTDTTKTSNDVSISGLDCAGVQISGTLTKDKAANNVTATLTYSGGNGKTYLTKSHSSTGVTGLSATLQAGTLAKGGGELVYIISGTPNTAGTADFAIDLGGKSCIVKIVVDDATQTIGKPGPNIKDADGNSYKTVTIGTQTWMAENLKVSKYNDGTIIPNISDDIQWSELTTGAWSYYSKDATNNAKYGKLYNWYAVSKTTNGDRNICPIGWHVPTDAEWTLLTDYLGGFTVAGGKMKEIGTASWNSPNTDATNTSLFSALPGGTRHYLGNYYGISSNSFWWSASENNSFVAWYRVLGYNNGSAFSYTVGKKNGFSVRCLKD